MRCVLILLGVLVVLLADSGQAHEVRPGYLQLRQTAPDSYELLFKVPALGADRRLGLSVDLPDGTLDVVPPQGLFAGGAHVERRTIRRPGGLAEQTIGIEGLSATLNDVLVRIENLNGAVQTERLTPTDASLVVGAVPSAGEVASTYLQLGIEHILFGFDHLLFVLTLVILVRGWRHIALTVTAFTVAHSLTLAAATLSLVQVPGPPVEAAIALSIMLVAAEIVRARHGQPSLTAHWPWLVAFAFGLLHGFGFAGALSKLGLPQQEIPIALLFFNLGVEMGQLAVVGCVLLFAWAVQQAFERLRPNATLLGFRRLDVAAAYLIGTVAAFWVAERTVAFWA